MSTYENLLLLLSLSLCLSVSLSLSVSVSLSLSLCLSLVNTFIYMYIIYTIKCAKAKISQIELANSCPYFLFYMRYFYPPERNIDIQ